MNNKGTMNNKGQMTIFMIVMVVGLFAALIMLLIGGIIIFNINDALDQDIQLGQVNLKNVTADTIGVYATTYINVADWWGMAAIFGMIAGLFLSCYLMRNTFPKWGIVLDIFIIVVVFFVALYFSSSYSLLLDILATSSQTFLEDSTPKSSAFMVNLPIYVVIIGVIMMYLFHSSIPKREEEASLSGAKLQGI